MPFHFSNSPLVSKNKDDHSMSKNMSKSKNIKLSFDVEESMSKNKDDHSMSKNILLGATEVSTVDSSGAGVLIHCVWIIPVAVHQNFISALGIWSPSYTYPSSVSGS